MTYKELELFITQKMKMNHIYQPVMLIALLEHRGKCHQLDIAKAILCGDEGQLEYYTHVTNKMVGRVLKSNGVVVKEGQEYALSGYEKLSPKQRKQLIVECKKKLIDYIENRSKDLWKGGKAPKYISGNTRYEVFKRAQFRCELCGTSAYEKALEVDHIIPKSHGGTDDINNFQALCFSCNGLKSNRDATDFRKWRELYSKREKGCAFCETSGREIESENNLMYAMRDMYPVSNGHTLIIPKRHVATYFELVQSEINSVNELIHQEKQKIEQLDNSVTGFNIGVNDGKTAGQTVMHCHVHLIPRRKGDVPDPSGGVRHVIFGKGYYKA